METAKSVRKGNPTYTESEKLAAIELAATIGIRPATNKLGISRNALRKWIDDHPELWSDLRAGDPAAFKQGYAQRLEDLADNYTATEETALEQVQSKLESGELDAKELAALIKAMGSSRGVATTGARAVRGEPDSISELNINFTQIEAAMERLLGSGGQAGQPEANQGSAAPALEGTYEDA